VFADSSRWTRWALYTAVGYGAFCAIVGVVGISNFSRFERLLAAVAPPLAGALGVLIGESWVSGAGWVLRGGADRPSGGRPLLSRANALLKQERWDDALAELEAQWTAFPGHGDLVMAYERCLLEGLRRPAAFAQFLRAAAPRLAGEDRAYAYWRLAELSLDSLGAPQDARLWCRRLEAEFPRLPFAEEARSLLARLPPSPRGNEPRPSTISR
jgi:hypothetical protein